jgi:hypothetical protein
LLLFKVYRFNPLGLAEKIRLLGIKEGVKRKTIPETIP